MPPFAVEILAAFDSRLGVKLANYRRQMRASITAIKLKV